MVGDWGTGHRPWDGVASHLALINTPEPHTYHTPMLELQGLSQGWTTTNRVELVKQAWAQSWPGQWALW